MDKHKQRVLAYTLAQTITKEETAAQLRGAAARIRIKPLIILP